MTEASERALELLKKLTDSNEEIDTLKAYIIDLKARVAIYVPIKGSAIDKKLAEYINNYPDRQKLRIIFMRESEGVYQFGTRRVFLALNNGKLSVKTGGGWLSLDEFLDQYTQTEVLRLRERSPTKRRQENIAVGIATKGHKI